MEVQSVVGAYNQVDKLLFHLSLLDQVEQLLATMECA